MKVEVQGPVLPNVALRRPYKGERRDLRKELYYALYINGQQIKIVDVKNGKQWPPRDKQNGLCIAWVEENISKNRYHFFRIALCMLIRTFYLIPVSFLANNCFVIKAKYKPRDGFKDSIMHKCALDYVTEDNYRNVPWMIEKDGLLKRLGNVCLLDCFILFVSR